MVTIKFGFRFKLDENSVPSKYVLQSITSQFPYYNDETEENAKLREKVSFVEIATSLFLSQTIYFVQDRKQWDLTKTLLTSLFRGAAAYAFKTGHLSASESEKYFESGKSRYCID